MDVVDNGEDGLYYSLTGIYDLIILDLMLPKISGLEILEKIESKVIILNVKSMLKNKLNGFKYGANDYLTKPFHIDELVARKKYIIKT